MFIVFSSFYLVFCLSVPVNLLNFILVHFLQRNITPLTVHFLLQTSGRGTDLATSPWHLDMEKHGKLDLSNNSSLTGQQRERENQTAKEKKYISCKKQQIPSSKKRGNTYPIWLLLAWMTRHQDSLSLL